MEMQKIIETLKAKAENTKTIAEARAQAAGYKRAVDIVTEGPLDDKTFALELFSEWCLMLSVIHMLECDEYAEMMQKIYVKEDNDNEETE